MGLACTDWCCVTSVNLTGLFEGDTADISCPYPKGYEDKEKFFCRGEHRDNCLDQSTVNKSGVSVDLERFSSTDDAVTRILKVKIKDLREEDSGIYWCGFDRSWKTANYTRVFLSVGEL